MIVGSAPLRVSLLGGGSDVPAFFNNNLGAVLGGSINSRVYVCVINMAQSADYPFRFTYRQVDNAHKKSEIEHPVWRKLLEARPEIERLNAATFSDVPGNSGLGSSSSFTVAAIAALDLYLKQDIDKRRVCLEAIGIERKELSEPGGWQDQFHATYGGFRLYTFKGEEVEVGEELLSVQERDSLNKSSILVKIGADRNSSKFHSPVNSPITRQAENDLKNQAELACMGAQIFSSDAIWSKKFEMICDLMTENWKIKKSIEERSTSGIDALITFGLANGAESAKLCGAGGSGYVLFLGQPDGIENLKKTAVFDSVLDFKFDSQGVQSTNV
jgi:D-glycero-alpha-D-manno-heptose-7-phosphate kinase